MSSFSLATENPTDEIMKRAPFNWDEIIITPFMRITIIFQVIYGVVSLLFLLFYGEVLFLLDENMIDKRKTIIFNTLAFLLIFNQINSRKTKRNQYNVFQGAFQNKLFFVILLTMVLFQVLFVNYGGNTLECEPLEYQEFLICVEIGAGSLAIGFIARILPENLFPNISFLKEEKKSIYNDRIG